MKIKLVALLIAVCIGLAALQPVAARLPNDNCDRITLSVVYPQVDNLGFAPRFNCGDQAQFNRIAARDPNFQAQRFPSAWQALNYWYILYGQELGVNLQPLPAPAG
jgi:hypothetical protein